jgi:hypothetical protein
VGDGSGSESCSVTGCGVSSVDPSCYIVTECSKLTERFS